MKNKVWLVVGGTVVAIFLWGVLHLFLIRFSAGDVYPYYSSLRSDPLGTKVLYESLQRCCRLSVRRNFEPVTKWKREKNTAVLFLGVSPEDFHDVPEVPAGDLDSFIKGGGRMVISFVPRNQEEIGAGALIDKLSKLRNPQEATPLVNLTDRWGFRFADNLLPRDSRVYAKRLSADASMPEQFSCHTSLYFRGLDPAWKIMYSRGEFPVLMERTLDRGTIVLSADSYFLSNEAMFRERHAALLSHLVENTYAVIFDEYHFGITVSPGVMGLVWKYRLQGLLLAIVFLAALFVWKVAVPLVPFFEEDPASGEDSGAKGKESAAGLTNLLRRNIPANRILGVCFEQWKKTQAPDSLRKEVEALMENKQTPTAGEVVEMYNQISNLLKKKT